MTNEAPAQAEAPNPAQLEQRRREIVLSLTTRYQGYDDPEVPLDLLRELAFICSKLRRKNSGPPSTKRNGARRKFTVDDLEV